MDEETRKTVVSDLERSVVAMFDAFEAMIEEFDCALIGVFDDTGKEPPFTYSVGLRDKDWPELIIVGLPTEVAGTIINAIVESGVKPEVGQLVPDGVANYPLRYGMVDAKEQRERLTCSIKRQELRGLPPITALQIIFPDPEGRWEGDEGYDEHTARCQPILAKPVGEVANDNEVLH